MLPNPENPTHLEGGARGVLDHWFEVSRIDPWVEKKTSQDNLNLDRNRKEA